MSTTVMSGWVLAGAAKVSTDKRVLLKKGGGAWQDAAAQARTTAGARTGSQCSAQNEAAILAQGHPAPSHKDHPAAGLLALGSPCSTTFPALRRVDDLYAAELRGDRQYVLGQWHRVLHSPITVAGAATAWVETNPSVVPFSFLPCSKKVSRPPGRDPASSCMQCTPCLLEK